MNGSSIKYLKLQYGFDIMPSLLIFNNIASISFKMNKVEYNKLVNTFENCVT